MVGYIHPEPGRIILILIRTDAVRQLETAHIICVFGPLALYTVLHVGRHLYSTKRTDNQNH